MDTAGYSKWGGGLEEVPGGMSSGLPHWPPWVVWGLMGEGRATT